MNKNQNKTPGFRRIDSRRPYFEGYYFKFINEKKELVILIAGISISKNEKYSFIQVASNYNEKVKIYKFPFSDFKSSRDSFSFSIGKNTFKRNEITLELDNIKAHLKLKKSVDWVRNLMNPNIMGYLSFIPKVECKHDIITVQAEVTGSVEFPNRTISFIKSCSYIEKNWGHSFPSEYLWIHANQFKDNEMSLQFAIAKPKWFLFRPKVHIGYLKNGKFMYFGSHRLSFARVSYEGNKTLIKINKFNHLIKITVTNKKPINLPSPKDGKLQNEISEYLNSNVELRVFKKNLFGKNKKIIHDISKLSTTEVHSPS